MSQAVETKLDLYQDAGVESQVDAVFEGGKDLIAEIPGDQFVRRAITDRLLRGFEDGTVEMVDAFNVGKDENSKMWVLARLGTPNGATDRTLFIDDHYRGGFGSPELSEECNTALGAIAMGHDARGASYYDSIFYRSV